VELNTFKEVVGQPDIKNTKMNTQNRTTIKILGTPESVKETAQKIEALFPIYIESPTQKNSDGNGVHLYITVPTKNNNCLVVDPRQETQPQTAQLNPSYGVTL